MLSKTRRIFNKDKFQKNEDLPFFSQRDEETGELLSGFWIEGAVWTDLGSPKTVTVTIEPGDLLNPRSLADAMFPEEEK